VSTVARRPILLFTNGWTLGGMEQHIQMLAAGLAARGFRISVVCSSRPTLARFRDELVAAGVVVRPVAEASSKRALVRRLRDLAGVVSEEPGCIVHMHFTGYHGGSLVHAAAALGRAHAVVRTEHNPPVGPRGPVERAAMIARDLLLSRIIFVSGTSHDEHMSLLHRDPRKCVVVPNGVDIDRYKPSQPDDDIYRELGVDRAAPLIGTVARLEEVRKGIADFIAMAAIVHARNPATRFLIVGDGTLRSQLEAQARDLGVAGAVRFAGARSDVPRLLSMMDVFVIPSLYEAGQYTMLEAMAMSRAVVATPTGLAPEAIQHGTNGLLVPFSDPAAIASAVGTLLGDPALAGRMGDAARRTIVSRYSAEAMIDGTVRVYESLG
jgi:glycosyltransferase involved in cell wall biosynthesis